MLRVTCLAFLFSFSLDSIASAAPQRSGPGSSGSNALKRAGLKVGDALPSVKIHDEQGKEFNTSSLKGSYTVLTFGCLT